MVLASSGERMQVLLMLGSSQDSSPQRQKDLASEGQSARATEVPKAGKESPPHAQIVLVRLAPTKRRALTLHSGTRT